MDNYEATVVKRWTIFWLVITTLGFLSTIWQVYTLITAPTYKAGIYNIGTITRNEANLLNNYNLANLCIGITSLILIISGFVFCILILKARNNKNMKKIAIFESIVIGLRILLIFVATAIIVKFKYQIDALKLNGVVIKAFITSITIVVMVVMAAIGALLLLFYVLAIRRLNMYNNDQSHNNDQYNLNNQYSQEQDGFNNQNNQNLQ